MSLVELPYEESLPPSLLGLAGGGPSTGATAGIPGTWTPAGSTPPATQVDVMNGVPYTIRANPLTPWTTGQYMQTATAGAPGRVTWTGTAWVGGVATMAAGAQGAPPEVEPPEEQAYPAGDADSSAEPPPPERRRTGNGKRRT